MPYNEGMIYDEFSFFFMLFELTFDSIRHRLTFIMLIMFYFVKICLTANNLNVKNEKIYEEEK